MRGHRLLSFVNPFGLLCIFVVVLVTSSSSNAAFPRPTIAGKGMVVSAHPKATSVGLRILKQGGNASDAAIATAFAIGVTEPYSAGIGGGGFLLHYNAKEKKTSSLDFRERAPLAASRDMYLNKKGQAVAERSTDGYMSIAVPGTVAGLFELHQKRGSLPWKTLLAPAIDLAQNGFVVDDLWEEMFDGRKELLTRFPATRAVFTHQGRPYRAGELLLQRDLAVTLQKIARQPRSFYEGDIAQKIVRDVQEHGGLLTLDDLKAYQPTWRAPLCGLYRGFTVCSMPPPSSGGVHLLQMLTLLEQEPMRKRGFHHVDSLHALIENMRSAYADRAEHLGDPAFHKVPTRGLLDDKYLSERRKNWSFEKARRSKRVLPGQPNSHESQDTSHLTVVDKDRNAVTLTFTVNYDFGSGVVAAGTGILLNDEMDDFSASPGVPNKYGLVGGKANAVAPAKIPLSSMSPTLVHKNGQLVMALGAPGGSTIITTVLQVILNVVDHEMNAGAAISAPRLHHQWIPDVVRLEKFGFDPATKAALMKRGFSLMEREGWGNGNLILVRDDGRLEGAPDPRGVGVAAGH
ncbi:MAG: gamma-glutamyltransferase [Deltaproteobacteria bacterium]|nr:gamma-glutamyltransferase [Deltaproteobacteria bacterium]